MNGGDRVEGRREGGREKWGPQSLRRSAAIIKIPVRRIKPYPR